MFLVTVLGGPKYVYTIHIVNWYIYKMVTLKADVQGYHWFVAQR